VDQPDGRDDEQQGKREQPTAFAPIGTAVLTSSSSQHHPLGGSQRFAAEHLSKSRVVYVGGRLATSGRRCPQLVLRRCAEPVRDGAVLPVPGQMFRGPPLARVLPNTRLVRD
jgi:hypothetical protein